MLNLAVILEDSAHEDPDRDAVVYDDLRLSYSVVNGVANQVANLLASRAIGRGDKVALCCPNLPYFPLIYFGVLKAGATIVPLNVLLEDGEFAYQLTDSDAVAFFCFEGVPDLPIGERGLAGFRQAAACRLFVSLPADPAARPCPAAGAESFWPALAGQPATFETARTEPGDTAVILYGSGTTGKLPTGAELTHQNMLLNAIACDLMFERTGHDVFLATLPLFHSFGQTVIMNTGFFRRATLVLLARFEAAAALTLMAKEKITLFAGVPTMFWELLNCDNASGSDAVVAARHLRLAVSGGATLPLEVLRGFEERYGVGVLEGYGLSETSPVASFSRPDRPIKPGSIGLPVWGVEMKLIDDGGSDVHGEQLGEIVIRGHNVMKGYYGRPDLTAQVIRDGWLRTGDIARRDTDGYFYIVDRAVDVIIREGCKVFPRQIEEVLMTHPQVSLVAVRGERHCAGGTQVMAYVVRRPGAALTETELIGWCRQNMACRLRPHGVKFRDGLPMTATGKILKRSLR